MSASHVLVVAVFLILGWLLMSFVVLQQTAQRLSDSLLAGLFAVDDKMRSENPAFVAWTARHAPTLRDQYSP